MSVSAVIVGVRAVSSLGILSKRVIMPVLLRRRAPTEAAVPVAWPKAPISRSSAAVPSEPGPQMMGLRHIIW